MFEFFQDIIRFLNDNGISYMLSGSVALSVYTLPRATRDIDIVVEILPDDVNKFVQHFSKNYYVDKDAIFDAMRRESMFNIIDSKSGFKVDFILLKSSDYHQTAFSRRRITEFMEMPIYTVSPEDLILAKIIWIQDYQSAQQMTDIANLLDVTLLDRNYIHHWINQLNLVTFDLSL